MRKGFLYGLGISILTLLIVSCETDPDLKFHDHFIKYYGGDGNQEGKDFVINADGSIVMIGTSIETNGIAKVYIVKTTPEGDILWSKKYGHPFGETAQDIELIKSDTYSGELLLLTNVARSDEDDNDSTNVKITRIRQNGDKIDSVLYDQFKSQRGNSVLSLSDGGFIFTGNTTDTSALTSEQLFPGPESDREDVLSLRYSQSLQPDVLWAESFGGESFGSGTKIIETSPNQFYFAGYTDAIYPPGDNLPDLNFWFTKVVSGVSDGSGFYNGVPRYSEAMTDIVRSNFNGVFFAIGTATLIGESRMYGCVVSPSFTSPPLQSGYIENSPVVGEGVAIAESSKEFGNFWVVGNEVRGGGRNIWIGKVDANSLRATVTMKFGGANNDDTASAVAELPNGDVAILGTMELVNQKKMVLIKVRPNGKF